MNDCYCTLCLAGLVSFSLRPDAMEHRIIKLLSGFLTMIFIVDRTGTSCYHVGNDSLLCWGGVICIETVAKNRHSIHFSPSSRDLIAAIN